MEPVDGAAVDEGRELAEAGAEGVPDGTHRQHDVQLVATALHKHVEESDGRAVRLLRLLTLPATATR